LVALVTLVTLVTLVIFFKLFKSKRSTGFAVERNGFPETLGETIPLNVFLVRETRNGDVDDATAVYGRARPRDPECIRATFPINRFAKNNLHPS
jgi:hypothetical protein